MKQTSRIANRVAGVFGVPRPDNQKGGAAVVGSHHLEDFRSTGPMLLAASELEGDEVRNPIGVRLGHIEEILLDVPAGRIAFALLSCSSGERSGDRFCAVPWSALTYDGDNKCFILEMSRERFEQAPSFDKHDWPRMSDRRWIEELHAHFGAVPYEF